MNARRSLTALAPPTPVRYPPRLPSLGEVVRREVRRIPLRDRKRLQPAFEAALKLMRDFQAARLAEGKLTSGVPARPGEEGLTGGHVPEGHFNVVMAIAVEVYWRRRGRLGGRLGAELGLSLPNNRHLVAFFSLVHDLAYGDGKGSVGHEARTIALLRELNAAWRRRGRGFTERELTYGRYLIEATIEKAHLARMTQETIRRFQTYLADPGFRGAMDSIEATVVRGDVQELPYHQRELYHHQFAKVERAVLEKMGRGEAPDPNTGEDRRVITAADILGAQWTGFDLSKPADVAFMLDATIAAQALGYADIRGSFFEPRFVEGLRREFLGEDVRMGPTQEHPLGTGAALGKARAYEQVKDTIDNFWQIAQTARSFDIHPVLDLDPAHRALLDRNLDLYTAFSQAIAPRNPRLAKDLAEHHGHPDVVRLIDTGKMASARDMARPRGLRDVLGALDPTDAARARDLALELGLADTVREIEAEFGAGCAEESKRVAGTERPRAAVAKKRIA
jgi:hypothetical protein